MFGHLKLIEFCLTKGFQGQVIALLSIFFAVPAAAPRFNAVVALNNQRAFVSWFALPQDDYGAIILRGYRVYYLSRRNYQTRNVTVRPDQLQVELTDLNPSTYYYIWISAFTAMGEGPRSSSYWIKTSK